MRRVLLAGLILCLPQLSSADGLENAYFLCDLFEKTGVSTDCQPSNASSTIDVVIEGTEAEAAEVCSVIVRTMAERRRTFGGRWKLRLFSPERADVPLAVCALR